MDAARIANLTTGTPVSTFCVDANQTQLTGVELEQCRVKLSNEFAVLHKKLVEKFAAAELERFHTLGSPFDANKTVANFGNVTECETEINTFVLLAQVDSDACKSQCANVTLAANCLHGKVRDLLRAEQTKAEGNVSTPLEYLARAQLLVFDKVFGADERAAFLAIGGVNQSIDGLMFGRLAQTIVEMQKGNYLSYNRKFVHQIMTAAEVRVIATRASVELTKDARIADALNRLNAQNDNQATAAVVNCAFRLAANRVEKVDAPVAIRARVSNFAAADEKTITDAFRAVLGPDALIGNVTDDPKNDGKKQTDVVMGVDEGEISAQDTEFRLQCVKSEVNCEIVEDVHKAVFDLVQQRPPCAPFRDNLNCFITSTTSTMSTSAPSTPSTTSTQPDVTDSSAATGIGVLVPGVFLALKFFFLLIFDF